MKEKLLLAIFAFLVITCSAQISNDLRVVCYYDSTALHRSGDGIFLSSYLAESLQVCSHLVYGWAEIIDNKLIGPDAIFDPHGSRYQEVLDLKRTHPSLRVLLAVGGGRDKNHTGKYLTLLESSEKRISFVTSAKILIKSFGFDGLDLAWQFPPNEPMKVQGFWASSWSYIKGAFMSPEQLDPKAAEHKQGFVSLVHDLKQAFSNDGLLLSVSVLPNTNSTLFFNIPALVPSVDMFNLWAFDYFTPHRYPNEANYPAPLFKVASARHDEFGSSIVEHWLENGAPSYKLNFGIPTYGHSWKLSRKSGTRGTPPISETNGAGESGPYTRTAGLLSYPEICDKLQNPMSTKGVWYNSPRDDFPAGRVGVHAMYVTTMEKELDTWVGFEDPETVAYKATFARAKRLGGVSIHDLTLDDFKGTCGLNRYPLLRAVLPKNVQPIGPVVPLATTELDLLTTLP